MQGSFTSHTYNVTALLGRTSFPSYTASRIAVPPFQRGYSWEQSHVSTFWEDIFEFHNQSRSGGAQDTYFLGPIVILPNEDRIILLDGQQRLATITILLSVIRDIARAKGGQIGGDLARDIHRDIIMVDDDAGIYALTLGELDEGYFLANVQEDPPSSNVKARLRSHRLIQQARDFLYKKVEELISNLNTNQLVSKLKAFSKTVAYNLMLVAIEVRSEEEAYLIFETLNDRGLRLAVPDLVLNYLMSTAKKEAEKKGIRQSWNLVVENLGEQRVSTFIRHMWVSQYGDVKTNTLFRVMRNKLKEQGITSLEFAQLCAQESQRYISITGLDETILGKDALPHVEGLVKYLQSERSLPLLLSGLVCLNQKDFAKLAHALVTVITRYSVLAHLNPSNLEDTLYAAARSMRTRFQAGGTSKSCLNEAKDMLRRMNPTQQQIRGALPEVFLTRKEAGYVVYSLAEKAQTKTKALNLSLNSLEHIFPENAEKSDWPKAKEMEMYVWHLGNLSVLEPPFNRAAGRKGYTAKKAIYAKSEITMTKTLPNTFNTWDVKSILDRANKLLSLIGEVWPEII
jgi:hypothetical protein